MSSPAACVAVDALGMTPRNYGHLIQMAARYARQRLDGHAVVNRQTGAPVMLDWERGLKNATAPGMPPVLLLTVPAIPAMLAAARYVGALAPRPPYPPHVLRYHAFEAMAEIGGRRIKATLIVQEDRQHRLFLDRLLGGEALPQRNAGGANSDTPNPATLPADDAASADVATAPPGEQSIAGSTPPTVASRVDPASSDTAAVPPASTATSPPAGGNDAPAPPNASQDTPASDAPGASEHGWLMRQIIGANDWLNRQMEPVGRLINSIRVPPGPNDLDHLPPRPFNAMSRVDPHPPWEDIDEEAVFNQRAARRAELESQGLDPKTDPLLHDLNKKLEKSRNQKLEIAGAIGAPIGPLGNGLAGLAERGMSAIGRAVESRPIAEPLKGSSTPPHPSIGPTQEPPAEGTGSVDTPPAASAPNSMPAPPARDIGAGQPPFYDRLDDFKQFRREKGLGGEDPLSHAEAARAYVMDPANADAEHFVAYDANRNAITHAGTSLDKFKTAGPPDLEAMERDPTAKMTRHHSHPNDVGLSGDDVATLPRQGMEWVAAHGAGDELSAARLTPQAETALRFGDEVGQMRAKKLLRRLWNESDDALSLPMNHAVVRGEFTRDEMTRISTEIVNRALADAGIMEYVTTREIPSTPFIEEMRALAKARVHDIIRSNYRSWPTMYLIRRPSRWASDKEWQEFLAKMLTLPRDNPDVAEEVEYAVEYAREELDLRSGKATWAEIRARRQASLDALEPILPPSPTETVKSEQDAKKKK